MALSIAIATMTRCPPLGRRVSGSPIRALIDALKNDVVEAREHPAFVKDTPGGGPKGCAAALIPVEEQGIGGLIIRRRNVKRSGRALQRWVSAGKRWYRRDVRLA